MSMPRVERTCVRHGERHHFLHLWASRLRPFNPPRRYPFVVMTIRQLAVAIVRAIQGRDIYKRVVFSIGGKVGVREADDRVHSLFARSFGLHWGRQKASGHNCMLLIAERKGKIVGWVKFVGPPKGTQGVTICYLTALRVRVPYRRMGIGRRLSREVIRKAVEEGCTRLFVSVRESNRPALLLYEKLGFKVTDGVKGGKGSPGKDENVLMSLTTGFPKRVA